MSVQKAATWTGAVHGNAPNFGGTADQRVPPFEKSRSPIASREGSYRKAASLVALSARANRRGEADGGENQRRHDPDRGGHSFAGMLPVRERALFEGLEISQRSCWLWTGSKNPRDGMDLFL